MAGARVLVVDDHPDILRLFEACLTIAGYRVTSASNAAEGLQLAANGVDAIATDLAMPGMDGIEFIRKMRAARTAFPVPILAITGQSIDPLKITRNDIDCCRLLVKPCNMEQFEETLRFLLDSCVHDCQTCPHRLDQIVVPARNGSARADDSR